MPQLSVDATAWVAVLSAHLTFVAVIMAIVEYVSFPDPY